MIKILIKFRSVFFVLLCLPGLNQHVFARDISNEQRAVTEAREEQNAAQTNLIESNKHIVAQEKRVADEQIRLQTLKQEQQAAQSRLDKANIQLERNLSILEKAWPERNR